MPQASILWCGRTNRVPVLVPDKQLQIYCWNVQPAPKTSVTFSMDLLQYAPYSLPIHALPGLTQACYNGRIILQVFYDDDEAGGHEAARAALAENVKDTNAVVLAGGHVMHAIDPSRSKKLYPCAGA